MNDMATMLDPHRFPNEDIFEELSAAARKAASWDVAFRPAKSGTFQQRVLARRNEVLKLESEVAALPSPPPDADAGRIALQDMRASARLLRTGITAATVKPQEMEKLPRIILPSHEDEPRVSGICALYVRTVRGEFSEPTFIAFIRTLQEQEPLTVFELWSLPAFLRFALLEAIIVEAQALLRGTAAPGGSQLPALM